jgi:catechol 1,2-dioxygenase
VRYDVGMSKILHVEAASIDKLTGKYTEVNDEKKTAEIFNYQNRVWKKNEAFGDKFEYVGNNTFEESNNPPNLYWKLEFKMLPSGSIELTESFTDVDFSKKVFVYQKAV